MVPKKAVIFSSYTSLISVYVLLCIIVIIIKNHYFSLVLTELEKKNNGPPVGKNHRYNIRDKTDELKTIDLSIDVSEIDSTIERVFNTCENNNLITQLKPKHFLHSKKHNVLFCWIRKVASKSFTKFFADLEDYQIMRDSYDRELDSFDVENVEDLVNLIDDRTIFKFFAVRHPFVRLVASYRDRIEDNSKYSAQAWIYVPKIFHITRPQLFYRNKSTSPLYKIFDRDRRLKIIPTFQEFIIGLLKQPESLSDFHWTPYYSHCSVCQVNFDYILKLDNYSIKDFSFIFANAGINQNNWEFPQIGTNMKGATTFQITCSYLSTLSLDMFHKLYAKYRIDFEMFDYDYKMYENCIKK